MNVSTNFNTIVNASNLEAPKAPKKIDKTLKIVGAILLTLGALLAAATVITALLFTAAPIVFISICSSIGAVALAAKAAGITCLVKNHKKKPKETPATPVETERKPSNVSRPEEQAPPSLPTHLEQEKKEKIDAVLEKSAKKILFAENALARGRENLKKASQKVEDAHFERKVALNRLTLIQSLTRLPAEEILVLKHRLAKLEARPSVEGIRGRRRNEKIVEVQTKIALLEGSRRAFTFNEAKEALRKAENNLNFAKKEYADKKTALSEAEKQFELYQEKISSEYLAKKTAD